MVILLSILDIFSLSEDGKVKLFAIALARILISRIRLATRRIGVSFRMNINFVIAFKVYREKTENEQEN